MRSKNAPPLTPAEREHMGNVKCLPCSVCDAPSTTEAPTAAHHINQGQHFTTVALCYDCHQGHNGWHGNKSLWRIRKFDEMDALNITLKRLAGEE